MEALGLQDQALISIKIVIEPRDVVVTTVAMVMREDQAEKLAEVLKEYELHEISHEKENTKLDLRHL